MRIAQISEGPIEEDDGEGGLEHKPWVFYATVKDVNTGDIVWPPQEHEDPDVAEILAGPYMTLESAIAAVEQHQPEGITVESGFPNIRHFWVSQVEEVHLSVDGHHWSYRRDAMQPGTVHYTWHTPPNGPDPGPDGFSVSPHLAWGLGEQPPTPEERDELLRAWQAQESHETLIREHMAMVERDHRKGGR